MNKYRAYPVGGEFVSDRVLPPAREFVSKCVTPKIKEGFPDIGIIILTTFDSDEHIFRGIEAGARGYVLKDSPPGEVLSAIRAVHRGEPLIQP